VSSESSLKDDLQEVLAPLLRQGDQGGLVGQHIQKSFISDGDGERERDLKRVKLE
jgi:hypothetical protein